jgi:hypothetical protein
MDLAAGAIAAGVGIATTGAVGATSVRLTFDDVTQAGRVTITGSSAGPSLPAGFLLAEPALYYDLRTTATFLGAVEVCIQYAGIVFLDESQIALLHYEDGAWVDRTISLDTTLDRVCGRVESLSPFAVAQRSCLTISGFSTPLVALVPVSEEPLLPGKAFKRGQALPLMLGLSCQEVAVTEPGFAPRIVEVTRSGEALPLETITLDTGQANDHGLLFRRAGGKWVYNMSTGGLSVGTYAITIELADRTRYISGFVLK